MGEAPNSPLIVDKAGAGVTRFREVGVREDFVLQVQCLWD
jgi:hypothetical protein